MSEFILRADEMKTNMTSLYSTNMALYGVRAGLAVQILRLRYSGSSTTVYALRNRLSCYSKRIGNEITNINSIVNTGNTVISKAKTAEMAAKLEMSGLLDIIKRTWPFNGLNVGNTVVGGGIVGTIAFSNLKVAGNVIGEGIWEAIKATTPGGIIGGIIKPDAKGVVKVVGNTSKTIAEYAEKGFKEGTKSFIGLTPYFAKGTELGKGFGKHFIDGLKTEVSKYADVSSASKTIGTVAKWAGVAAEVVSEGFENYDEYKKGGITARRAVAETVIESGVDIGLGIAASGATGAALAAVGVAAPAVAVAAVAGVAVWGVNKIVTHFTGKDIGEHVADFYCDHIEGAVKTVKKVGKTIVKWAKSIWPFK